MLDMGYNSSSITISLLNALDLDHGLNWHRRISAHGMNALIDPIFFINPSLLLNPPAYGGR